MHKKRLTPLCKPYKMEVPPGFGPGIKVLQTFALPLGDGTTKIGAVDETRTRDLHLGKVALYQLSYYRIPVD